MVVWLKPCKSRSLPGAFTETLQPNGLGGFFFSGWRNWSPAKPAWTRPWPMPLPGRCVGCPAARSRRGPAAPSRRPAAGHATPGTKECCFHATSARDAGGALRARQEAELQASPAFDEPRSPFRSSQMRNSVSRLFNGIFTSRPRKARRVPCERGLRLWGGCSLEPEQSGGS